jgi:hypothetical protein
MCGEGGEASRLGKCAIECFGDVVEERGAVWLIDKAAVRVTRLVGDGTEGNQGSDSCENFDMFAGNTIVSTEKMV